MEGKTATKLNYATFLKLGELLDLQEVLSDPPEHDETLFIIIHQTYELWFKLMLFEIEKIKRDFSKNDLFGAIATFKRIRTVMKTLVAQFDILETMTPMSFVHFRDRLDTASGFQSTQFRELEFVLGQKRPEVLKAMDPTLPAVKALESRLKERSLVDYFYDFLEKRGVKIPPEIKSKDVTFPSVPDEKVQEGVLRLYKNNPDVAILFELMMDFDEGQQEWRYRHMKLAERTIGDKRGTGGTPGVAYLRETLFKPIFADLWAIRHKL